MVTRPTRERFSNVDAAWLHMESSTNMAMITGVMTFDSVMDYGRLRAIIENDLLAYERFCQKVVEPPRGVGLPYWQTDPGMDLDWHIQRVQLPEPADQGALQALVSQLMSTPLDFSRPLWQMHLVENYRSNGTPCAALISRLHHCIADGIALMQVMLGLTESRAEEKLPLTALEDKDSSFGSLEWILQPVSRAGRNFRRTWSFTRALIAEGTQTLFHPKRMLDVARLGASGTRALGKLLLIGPDRRTRFKGRCEVSKRAAWSLPVPLDEVKRVGRLMNATVNDVLLACVTGALRRYLEGHDDAIENVNIRAVVPVSIRPDEDLDKLGNRFGLVFLSLPIYERDVLRRLRVLKRRMDAIKDSPEAMVAFSILAAIGMTPIQIEKIIVGIFGMKGTAVMTNVPGPQKQLYLAGSALRSIMFWVPQPAGLGMGVSIISYNRQVMVGIATDAGLVPDPEAIVAGFHAEFDEMARWGQPARRIRPSEKAKVSPNAQADSFFREISPQTEPEIMPVQEEKVEVCLATTRAGRPCKNRVKAGAKYCHVHAPASNTDPLTR